MPYTRNIGWNLNEFSETKQATLSCQGVQQTVQIVASHDLTLIVRRNSRR